MKKIYSVFLAVGLITITGSCSKLLDIKPVNRMIPVSVSDYEAVLVGGYPRTDYFHNTELLTDNAYANLSASFEPEVAKEPWFTFAPYHLTSGVIDDPYWGILYKAVFCANSIMDEFGKMKPADTDKALFEMVLGEAHALRAYSFFYLVNLYAEPYAPDHLKKPGIPMPLTAEDVHENTQNNVREPIEKVYAQILADLAKAKQLLNGKVAKNKLRLDAACVNLLFARIYLFMGDYEKAISFAGEVQSARPLFNMNEMEARIAGTQGGRQYTFSLNLGVIDTDYKNEVMFLTGGRANNNTFYHGRNFFKPSLELLALCQRSGIPDYREYIFANFADLSTTDGIISGPTTYNMYAKQEKNIYFIGLKASEAYVIRAEAYARTDRPAEAIGELNRLLVNRIKTSSFTPLKEADFADNNMLLQRVLEERRIELALEGGLRWFDLRRLGKPAQTHIYKNGVLFELKQNDPRYVLQIPISEQLASPNMPLNPR